MLIAMSRTSPPPYWKPSTKASMVSASRLPVSIWAASGSALELDFDFSAACASAIICTKASPSGSGPTRALMPLALAGPTDILPIGPMSNE